MRARAIHPVRRAFTLVELLVVISIFVLMLAIGVPAFSTLLYTSDESLSENALRQALAGARDAAARSASGQDAAAVFLYDQHRISIVTCLRVESVDVALSPGDPPVHMEVFAPVPGVAPVQLPRLWMVRGYAPPGRLDNTTWYERTIPPGIGRSPQWVFPETSFFDLDAGDDGADRQTFMVRFEGGTGRLSTAQPAGVLVFAPSPGSAFRGTAPWSTFRADREADPARFVRRVAAAATMSQTDRDKLLGYASDVVLAKPVGQLAIYNERRLAGALGARLNDATGCLYLPGPDPAYVTVSGGGQVPTLVTAWVEDRAASGTESEARVFSIHPHLGWLQELTGSKPTP